MHNRQLSLEEKPLVSSTGKDKSAMSSPSPQYRERSEIPTSSSSTSSNQTSPGSSISEHKNSKMFNSTTTCTSESHEGATTELINDACEFNRVCTARQNRNDESLQMDANNFSRTTQPARATSFTNTENEPTFLTTSSPTELNNKPRPKEKSHSFDPTAIPNSETFESPGDFIKYILSLEGQEIFFTLYLTWVSGEICIYKDDTVEYSLLRSLGFLDHNRCLAEDQRDDRFRCLVYAPKPKNKAERAPFHCYEDLQHYQAIPNQSKNKVLAKFVRLGWLQKRSLESKKDNTSKHTTNYGLLWNVSTKPHSLWICYDYYTLDTEGYHRRGQLGKPTYYNQACDDMYGPQTNAFHLEANLESDDESASQKFSYEHVFSDDVYFRDDADEYELSHEVSLVKPLPFRYTPSKGQNVNPGYFGIDRPFDLAVLATDINEWDGAAGLKRDSMYKCLETLRFRLGDTLRARAWVSTVQPES